MRVYDIFMCMLFKNPNIIFSFSAIFYRLKILLNQTFGMEWRRGVFEEAP